MNKRGRKTSFGERLVASFLSRSSLSQRDGGCPMGRSRLCPSQGKEEKSKCPLPSCPTGQAPGELLRRDKQQSPLLAKATQNHPEPSPSSFQPCTIREPVGPPRPPHLGAAIRGVPAPLRTAGSGFSPGYCRVPSRCTAGEEGGDALARGSPKASASQLISGQTSCLAPWPRLWFASRSQD